jgi:hypothetical protein
MSGCGRSGAGLRMTESTMTVLQEEQRHLDEAAAAYKGSMGAWNRDLTSAYTWRLLEEYVTTNKPVLLMGLGDGYIAQRLGERCHDVLIVEGSAELVEGFRARPGCAAVHSLFERYHPAKEYACVVGTHVLEHVDDPVPIIRRTTEWLRQDGVAIFTVPNRSSLHRRIGVKMGVLPEEAAFSEQDVALGHRRVYSVESLAADLRSGGYRCVEIGGYNVKVVPNRLMAQWQRPLLDAMFEVSRDLPAAMCADLIAVCRK